MCTNRVYQNKAENIINLVLRPKMNFCRPDAIMSCKDSHNNGSNEQYGEKYINTLRPRQDGSHFPDHIFKCIFFNENV